jgi:hypothetical protein
LLEGEERQAGALPPLTTSLEKLMILRALPALLLCAGVASAQTAPTPPAGFAPLNLLLTKARIDAVARSAPTNAVIRAARDGLLSEARPLLSHTPGPIAGRLSIPGFYTKRKAEMRRLTGKVRRDTHAAYTLAMAHAFGAGPDYARKAKEILFAWVSANTYPVDGPRTLLGPRGDTPIVVSYSFPHFCYAYDILSGTGWIDAAESQRFKTWLRPFATFIRRKEPFLNNHQNWKALFLASAAHVLGDTGLFDFAMRTHQRLMRKQIGRRGAMWRELIRGKKAATYTLMALEAAVQTVEIGERHGYALRSDRKLRRALDRLLDFVENPRSWRRYWLLTRHKTLNGPQRSTDWGWLYELPVRWWGEARHVRARGSDPHAGRPARAYTLGHATLLFRPLTARGLAGRISPP